MQRGSKGRFYASKSFAIGSKIQYIHFDSIDSTNAWAKSNAHTLDPDRLTCVTAQEQTAGKGRWHRHWLSPKGLNIYASLFFCIPEYTSYLGNIGQILAFSCAVTLQQKGFAPKLKWPNDILIEGKKVAGILCETVCLTGRLGIILGIGINVNMTQELLETIDQPATSLAQLSGHTWSIEQIFDPLLQQFQQDLETLTTQGFAVFQKPFEALLAFKGQQVSFTDGQERFEGICRSVTADGRLQLQLPSGALTTLSAGEITTRL